MKFMRSLTLGWKISLLAVILMLGMISVGFVGFLNSKRLGQQIENSSNVLLPSLRYATLIDMMHDGVRSVVYQSLYVAGANDEAGKKEVLDQLEEFKNKMHEYLDKIQKIDNSAEIAATLKTVMPELEAYLVSAETMVKVSVVENNLQKAKHDLPAFIQQFEALERSLEKFGDLIEKTVQDGEEDAKKAEKLANRYILVAIAVGVLFGSAASVFVTRSSLKLLAQVIDDLGEGVNAIQSASSSMASAAKELNESIVTQASSLQETAASVEEISSMVTKTSENSEHSNRLANSNHKSALQGKFEMDRLVKSVFDIEQGNQALLTTVEENNQKFGEMVQIITNISQKTKVINDIVFQTKLLAFNASVEAARAGEHGKGFAVVAQEVSNLASMSGNAAREIAEMVGDSVSRVETIIDSSRKQLEQIVMNAKGNVQNCMGAAEKCKSVLDEAVTNSTSVTTAVEEISLASREQARGVQEISSAVSEIDKTTQGASKVIQEVNHSSQDLEAQANSLKNAVHSLERLVG